MENGLQRVGDGFLKSRLLVLLFVLSAALPELAQQSFPRTFAVADGQFTLDGKPFQVISGEMHYPRILQAYSTPVRRAPLYVFFTTS
jgi:ABC-type Fe2+-enterobactin transport system substrate-binding protein